MTSTKLINLLHIKLPIIQAGMVWCSGWKLAVATYHAGGLGVIGAGSMSPDVLEVHLQKMASVGIKNYAVNLPLFYSRLEEQIALLEKYDVPIIITSAGNPKILTKRFKEQGRTVLHVVASLKFALKAQEAGVDAVIAEGFEAGGHNGRDELTTLVLLQLLKGKLNIPYAAAGGIGSGEAMAAAFALGAEAVQVGTLLAAAKESSAHTVYKEKLIQADENSTVLTLKELMPVRLLKTKFYEELAVLKENGASIEELKNHLGKGRSRKGVFEGNEEEGEFEVGQIAANISEIKTVQEIISTLISEYNTCISTLKPIE